MSVSLGANGNSYLYPEANDTGWAGDGTNWASAVSAALTSIGLGASLNSKAVIDLVSTTKGFLMPRMTTTQRDAIATPPAGLEIYNTTTNKVNTYNGSTWLSDISDGDTFTGNVTGNILQNFLHVQDQKSSGTNGGTFTSGSWQVRTLNTTLTNSISGASLASDKITLPAGTYYIESSAPAFAVNESKAKLYNYSDSSDILIGATDYSGSSGYGSIRNFVNGRFTLSAQKEIQLLHRCTTTGTPHGLGLAAGFSTIEVYSDVKIWRLN